jgi:protein ImuB
LKQLSLPAPARDGLLRLGVRTIGDLLRLPAAGLRERFGAELHGLHALASGDAWTPLQPTPEIEPVRRALPLDDAEEDLERLLFLVKRLLHPLLAVLAARGWALATLDVRLRLASRASIGARADPVREERLRPAAPTLDPVQILDLVRLRLEARRPSAGVVHVELEAHGVPATPEQIRLFQAHAKRDLAAGNRALARLRAELGEDAVVRAALREGHLPEAAFRWEPIDALSLPRPRDVPQRTLVRRVRAKPAPIAARPSRGDDWLLANLTEEDVAEHRGPYVVSGGWWVREAHREYYFLWTRRGEALWAYFDRARRRWYLQGRVE